MKLTRKIVGMTLIVATMLAVGCGKENQKEVVMATDQVTETVEPTAEETVEPTVVPTEEATDSTALATTQPEETAVPERTAETVLPIDIDDGRTVFEGEHYKAKLPKGWEVKEAEEVNAQLDQLLIAYNPKTKDEIYIKEQPFDQADTIDMEVYMKDLKDYYNSLTETSGVTILEAGSKSLTTINTAYLKSKTEVTEEMVKAAIEAESVKQEDIDAAGGMDAFIKAQNQTIYQLYIPNKNDMITITATLVPGREEELVAAAYEIADVMYLK